MVLLVVLLASLMVSALFAPVARRRVADPAPVPDPAGPQRRADLEAVVVDQLLDGCLSPADYRRAMEWLAARDAVREPVVVPDAEV